MILVFHRKEREKNANATFMSFEFVKNELIWLSKDDAHCTENDLETGTGKIVDQKCCWQQILESLHFPSIKMHWTLKVLDSFIYGERNIEIKEGKKNAEIYRRIVLKMASKFRKL